MAWRCRCSKLLSDTLQSDFQWPPMFWNLPLRIFHVHSRFLNHLECFWPARLAHRNTNTVDRSAQKCCFPHWPWMVLAAPPRSWKRQKFKHLPAKMALSILALNGSGCSTHYTKNQEMNTILSKYIVFHVRVEKLWSLSNPFTKHYTCSAPSANMLFLHTCSEWFWGFRPTSPKHKKCEPPLPNIVVLHAGIGWFWPLLTIHKNV